VISSGEDMDLGWFAWDGLVDCFARGTGSRERLVGLVHQPTGNFQAAESLSRGSAGEYKLICARGMLD
jgi:hypothetical protein